LELYDSWRFLLDEVYVKFAKQKHIYLFDPRQPFFPDFVKLHGGADAGQSSG
jgi:hypothetical protein